MVMEEVVNQTVTGTSVSATQVGNATNNVTVSRSPISPSMDNNANASNNNTNVYLVGLEFVRQYYTVLNQGPFYLHRFYSDDSSFVHGASARDNKVVYGQQEIHKKIQSLNFHNCHAKIRQVDSHSTLGDGVVIQVTGELSNNGQPMRKFMQTFVLAPQSPKRYYVRNDIFHYQDEIFSSNEEGDGEDEEELLSKDTNQQDTTICEPEAEEDEVELDPASLTINGGDSCVIVGVGNAANEENTSPTPVHIDNVGATATSPISDSNKGQQIDSEGDSNPSKEEEMGDAATEISDRLDTSGNSSVKENQTNETSDGGMPPTNSFSGDKNDLSDEFPPPASNKTYANLFKNATNKAQVNNNHQNQQQHHVQHNRHHYHPQQQQQHPFSQPSSQPHSKYNQKSSTVMGAEEVSEQVPNQMSPRSTPTPRRNVSNHPGQAGGRNRVYSRDFKDRDRERQQDRHEGRENRRERLSSRSSQALNDETASMDGDRERRRAVNTFPDANQLFVGNLPHFVTDNDMKEIFSEFGEVVEVKIQKPTLKHPNLKVPYFCFVVFENSASAQAAISKKSEIFMKLHGGGQRRLNVEPKRSQRGRPPQTYSKPPGNYNK